MPVIKLKAGQSVIVAAVDPNLNPDQGLPKPEQPVDPGYGIDLGLGVPSHPIVLPPEPTQPLPPSPGVPDQTLPGSQPHPDNTLPGSQPHPDNTLPPPGEIPPPIEPGHTPGWKLMTAWTPMTGWIVVAVPTGPIATPSKK